MKVDTVILNYYTQQGARTTVDEGTFGGFPDDISTIISVIQGLLVHPGELKLHNIKISRTRVNDRNLKTLQESINHAQKLSHKSLLEQVPIEERVVNICRHFSMFMCSVLREKGIPARTRCGFATYFANGWFDDHWICEYWHKQQKRWVRVDAEVDDILALFYKIDRTKINMCDLPKEAFFTTGVLWQLHRKGLVSGKLCGFSLDSKEFGEWYIRGNLLRDFFALNKVEYTYQELSKLMQKDYQPTKKELLLLDKIANLTINADSNFSNLLKLYNKHTELRP